MSSRYSRGKSPPSLMPRQFLMKPSSVMRFSGAMFGLCRSVFSMITE